MPDRLHDGCGPDRYRTRVEPAIEVVFIDTGYHFPETLETVELVRAPLRAQPAHHDRPARAGAAVADRPGQLLHLGQGRPAGAGPRRQVGLDERAAPARVATPGAEAPIVGRDRRGLVKVNPMANWTDLDVGGYIADHDVPVNPLLNKGYPSIGCWPCTRPVAPGEHSRAGRWAGLDKDRVRAARRVSPG